MRVFLFAIGLLLWGCSTQRLTQSEMDVQHQDVVIFQNELNNKFANKETSPLLYERIPDFKELDFFDIRSEFILKAKLKRTPNEKPFQMPTSAGKEKTFKKYGELHFTLQGKKQKLNVYQNLRLVAMPMYKNMLFLPFTDLSNGQQTYGGGRYIDLKISSDHQIVLNFNKAYNPYCAYSDRYNCPIPPKENHLPIAVLAGVKAYQK